MLVALVSGSSIAVAVAARVSRGEKTVALDSERICVGMDTLACTCTHMRLLTLAFSIRVLTSPNLRLLPSLPEVRTLVLPLAKFVSGKLVPVRVFFPLFRRNSTR